MDTLLTDIRYSLRALAARPVFTAAAVLTLALGIGGSTAIFGFVSAVLLRPLPYAEPAQLVFVTNVIPHLHAEMAGGGDYVDWRDRSRTLSAVAAYSPSGPVTLTGRGEPRRLQAARVSATFLPTLGVPVAAGRNIRADEDRPGAQATILTWRLWRRLFPDAPPGAERMLELDGALHPVVGVLPAGFVFPGHPEVELLVPLALDEARERARAWQKIVQIVGRVAPGATLEQVRAELKAIQTEAVDNAPGAPRAGIQITGSAPVLARPADVAADPPAGEPASPPARRPAFEMILKVVPLQRALVADVRPALLLFSAAVGLVLLMACAKMAKSTSPRRRRGAGMAVRSALGAGRGRLVPGVLTESAVRPFRRGRRMVSPGLIPVLALMPPSWAPFESAAGHRRSRPRLPLGLSLATRPFIPRRRPCWLRARRVASGGADPSPARAGGACGRSWSRPRSRSPSCSSSARASSFAASCG